MWNTFRILRTLRTLEIAVSGFLPFDMKYGVWCTPCNDATASWTGYDFVFNYLHPAMASLPFRFAFDLILWFYSLSALEHWLDTVRDFLLAYPFRSPELSNLVVSKMEEAGAPSSCAPPNI